MLFVVVRDDGGGLDCFMPVEEAVVERQHELAVGFLGGQVACGRAGGQRSRRCGQQNECGNGANGGAGR
ncbi:hypothetical protein [Burkholderia sp. BE12]|uniref:hypothetical protein n=1 Tax=Burkholderia sp. BE12 TaxID=2082394 RepID=UPI001F2797B5|nr:hypothetical protein [Burkholderia sp. BE12]